jgi:hypothetical protein
MSKLPWMHWFLTSAVQNHCALAVVVVVAVGFAVVTLVQWDPHRCNKLAMVSHILEHGKLACTWCRNIWNTTSDN